MDISNTFVKLEKLALCELYFYYNTIINVIYFVATSYINFQRFNDYYALV